MRFATYVHHVVRALIPCVLLLSHNTAPVQAQISDEFNYANNAALEAVWGAPAIGGTTAGSFTYNTGAGKLNATEMSDSDVGGYATAIFSRPVSHSGDLIASMEFDWNQSAVLGALFLELRGASGVIASGGLGDDTGSPGHAYMQVGGGTTYLGPNGTYIGGTSTFEQQTGAIATSFQNTAIAGGAGPIRTANMLGDSGSATLNITRFGDQLQVTVDNGTTQFSLGPISGPTENVTSIDLIYAGFAYGGPINVLTGDEGTHVAVDFVSLRTPNAPGDANGVGGVTIDDYDVIQANSFTKVRLGTNGDVNFDGFVDFEDFHVWKAHFPGGAAAADAAIASRGVPEPGTLAAGAVGMAVVLLMRGRRAKR